MNSKRLLILLLCTVVLSKLFVLGKGYLSFPDEYRHFAAQDAVEAIRNGNVNNAAKKLFEVQGRPGLVIAGILPASFQVFWANLSLTSYNSASSAWFIYIYNFLIFIGIIYYLYRITVLLCFPKEYSLFSIILYASTLNSYIYLRHVLPYDTSLLFGLMAFYLLLFYRENNKKTILFKASLALSFSFLIYPGYFPLVFVFFICWLLIIFKMKASFFGLLKNGISVLFVFFIPLGLIELLSLIQNTSYFTDAGALSKTITQGSFEEGFTFLFKYLWQVESGIGLIYILGITTIIMLIVVLKIEKKDISEVRCFFISLLLGFLIYALMVVVFHKMVFYARILHQFIPFLSICVSWAFLTVIKKMSSDSIQLVNFSFWSGLMVFLISLPLFFSYLKIQYPDNFAQSSLRQIVNRNCKIQYHCEWTSNLPRYANHNVHSSNPSMTLIFVNLCYPTAINNDDGWEIYKPKEDERLLLTSRHFMDFPAYWFEGAGIKQRERLRKHPLFLKLYIRN